jgi:hypothetical protein
MKIISYQKQMILGVLKHESHLCFGGFHFILIS